MRATLTITLSDAGQTEISGQSPDAALFLFMLEQARVALLQQALQRAMQAVVPAIAGTIPPFTPQGPRRK